MTQRSWLNEGARFQIAVSYAGNQRGDVEKLVAAIEATLGRGTVYFAPWYEFFTAGANADRFLQRIYSGALTEMVVCCMSPEYDDNMWPQMESTHIRSLEARLLQLHDDRERLRVVYIRVADGGGRYLPDNTIWLDLARDGVEIVADKIKQRLSDLRPRVYLAACSPERAKERGRIQKFLKDELRYRVESVENESPARLIETVSERLRGCHAFIRLFGQNPTEQELAEARLVEATGIRRIQHLASLAEFAPLKMSQPDYYAAAADVIESSFEDFKNVLRQLRSPVAAPRDKVGQVGVAAWSGAPDKHWSTARKWIFGDQQLRAWRLPAKETFESSGAGACHGYMILCDEVTRQKRRGRVRKALQHCINLQLQEKDASRRPPVALVYWAPPPANDDTWADLATCTPSPLFQIVGEDSAQLDKFFDRVRSAAR